MRHLFRFLEQVTNALSIMGIGVACGSILIVAALGGLNVVLSMVFHAPLPVVAELNSYLLSLIIFGAFALTARRQEHVSVDLVVGAMPTWIKFPLRLFSLITATAVYGLLAWRSCILSANSISINEIASAAYAFPVWPFKVAVSFLLIIATCEMLRQLLRALVGREWTWQSENSREA